jgi:hypothetical protein
MTRQTKGSRRMIALVVLGILWAPSGVFSQSRAYVGRSSIQPLIRVSFPMEAAMNIGYAFGGKLRSNIYNRYAIGLTYVYLKYHLNSGSDISNTRFFLDNIYYITQGKDRAFLCLGVGAYHLDSIPESIGKTSPLELGAKVGAGFEILVSSRSSIVVDACHYYSVTKANELSDLDLDTFSFEIGWNIFLN